MARTIIRERIPPADSRLGRRIHHDSESRRYTYQPRATTLVSTLHRRRVPIFDQGALGSCTGNAGIGCLATDPYFGYGPMLARYSYDEAGAVNLYSDGTSLDDYPGTYPPDDTGCDGLTIAKVLTAAGVISGYQSTFSLEAALLALMDTPIITGINWYQAMFTPNSEGLIRPGGVLAGGHEVVVDEYDARRGWVGFTNSWGTDWGKAGRFYMIAEDWGGLLAQQGDVTVFVPATSPPPIPTPVPPTPDRADAALVLDLGHWPTDGHVGANAKAAAAVRRWKKAKGL